MGRELVRCIPKEDRDFTKKFFGRKEEDRQGKGGKEDEGEEEKIWRGTGFCLLSTIGQSLGGVNAASENAQNNRG